MNKVLMTGLAVGTEVGLCDACNFDLDWMIKYPSVILWADRILITPLMRSACSSGSAVGDNKKLRAAVKLSFEILDSEGLLETVRPDEIIGDPLKEALQSEQERDRGRLAEAFPGSVVLDTGDHDVPGCMTIGGFRYCGPYVTAMYASLFLARSLRAHCLFSEASLNYCRHKFGISGDQAGLDRGRLDSFQSVFDVSLPNPPIFPGYVFKSKEKCAACALKKQCKSTYLGEVEHNLLAMCEWRKYEEVRQIGAVIDRIVVRQEENGGIIDAHETTRLFESEVRKLRTRLRSLFPVITKWASVAAIVSGAVAAIGLAAQYPLITVPAGVMYGLAKTSEKTISSLSKSYSWVGFLDRDDDPLNNKTIGIPQEGSLPC